ncbi:MAG: hypothetical protein P0Y56_14380 [Candidatus Andeanibacterium colombiense]|uniref:Phage shock protein B n=1 Tax=Candidatus Andeanibacterium colombiense TaxID=3121345 RepID=A0AAJ5X7U0_9SPHN|nr:MAG: hypothetical protein P0Y56_14380 [Sphingomonadaceae bacterium]
MGFWTAMVLISAFAMIGGIISARYRAHAGIGTDAMGGQFKLPPGDDAALRKEVEELRERVKVLERITTDANSLEARGSRAIADEIESLRGR